jgi:hypothetical protein
MWTVNSEECCMAEILVHELIKSLDGFEMKMVKWVKYRGKKKDILDLPDNGVKWSLKVWKYVSQQTPPVQCGVVKSKVGRTYKKRQKLCKTDNKAVHILTLWFFQKCYTVNTDLTTPMLHKKANETEKRLHTQNFQVSNGFLESFRRMHTMNF